MPARNTKKRRLQRQRRRVPIQNKLPPADSFNLKARSKTTWPFSLMGAGHDACKANGRLTRFDAKKRVPTAMITRMARGKCLSSRAPEREGPHIWSHPVECLRDSSSSARFGMTKAGARENYSGAPCPAAVLCHFAIKQVRSRCGNFRPPDFTRAIERGRNWK